MRIAVRRLVIVGSLLIAMTASGLAVVLLMQDPIPNCRLSSAPAWNVPSEAATPTGGGSGKIAFISTREGPERVYLSDLDGNQHYVIEDTSRELGFTWFPDGRLIIISTNAYIMNADGTNLRPFPNLGEVGFQQPWSPDSRQTVFFDDHGILRADINGTNEQRLTSNPGDRGPVWSPDGRHIAFRSDQDEHYRIYAMNADGMGRQLLTDNIDSDSIPVWSPDSKQLSYSRHGQIYAMDVDGTNQHKLTDINGSASYADWSPDGKWITFTAVRRDREGIYVMNMDTKHICKLTDDGEFNLYAQWQPTVQHATTR